MRFDSSYLQMVFKPDLHRDIISGMTMALDHLRKNGVEFQALAFRGVSGAAVAFPLSFTARIPIICVRKPDSVEHSHGYTVEGPPDLTLHRFLIVDDFVESGDTVRRICTQLNSGICAGVLYYNNEYNTRELSIDQPPKKLMTWHYDRLNKGHYMFKKKGERVEERQEIYPAYL